MIRLATDVGGTFTDLVGYDDRTGEVFTAKSLTTVHDQSEGVLSAIDMSEKNDGLRIRDVTFFAHGGTTVINAITERKGAKTALITTAGFRDVLEIGRGNRRICTICIFTAPNLSCRAICALKCASAWMPRGAWCNLLTCLIFRPIIRACEAEDVDAVAILFLHSYANPEHESHLR